MAELLESVVTNTTDGVLLADFGSNPGPAIIYVNDALTKLTGYTREELLGQQPDLLHRNTLSRRSLVLIKNAIVKKTSCNVEMINYKKNGIPYHVSVNISPVKDAEDNITHWISIHRDITRNIHYIKKIEEQNKKLKNIAWMHSHLVRSPLARIMSLVDFLVKEPPDGCNEVILSHLLKSAAELDKVIANITENTNIGSSRDFNTRNI